MDGLTRSHKQHNNYREFARRRNALRNASQEAILVRLRKLIVGADRKVASLKTAHAYAKSKGEAGTPRASPRGEQPHMLLGEICRRQEDVDEIALYAGLLCPFLADKSSAIEREISSVAAFELAPRGRVLIHQGMEGSRFYMLLGGEVDIFVDNRRIMSLQHGATFGETSLRSGVPTSATCVAATQCYLFTLTKKQFLYFFSDEQQVKNKETAAFFREHVRCLQKLSEKSLLKLAAASVLEKYKPGQCFDIDNGSRLYVVESGTVEILQRRPDADSNSENSTTPANVSSTVAAFTAAHKASKELNGDDEEVPTWMPVTRLTIGGMFGQTALFPDLQRGFAAATLTKCMIFCISKNAVHNCLSQECMQALRNETAFRDQFHVGRMGMDLPDRRLRIVQRLQDAERGPFPGSDTPTRMRRRPSVGSASSPRTPRTPRSRRTPSPPPRLGEKKDRRKHMQQLKKETMKRYQTLGLSNDDEDIEVRGIGQAGNRVEVVKSGRLTQGGLLNQMKALASKNASPSLRVFDDSNVGGKKTTTTTELVGSAIMGWLTDRRSKPPSLGSAPAPGQVDAPALKRFFAKGHRETTSEEAERDREQEEQRTLFMHMTKIQLAEHANIVLDTRRQTQELRSRDSAELVAHFKKVQEEQYESANSPRIGGGHLASRPPSVVPPNTAVQSSLSWALE